MLVIPVVLLLCASLVACKPIPQKDIEYFGKIAIDICQEDCIVFKRIGCCDKECWTKQDCWSRCWNAVCRQEPCCKPPGKYTASRVQNGHRVMAIIKMPLGPPLCPVGGGDPRLPPLPETSASSPASVPFAAGDLAVVAITQKKEFRRDGLVNLASKSWASRLPTGSVTFTLDDKNLTAGHTRWAALQNPSIVKVQCPSYWHLDCDTYNSHMYTGPIALQRVLQQKPDTKWFMLIDDDTFIDPLTLAKQVSTLPVDEPICIGRICSQAFGDGASDAKQLFTSDVLEKNFSWLSGGSGIVCNNGAMRKVYRHLELGPVEATLKRYGPTHSDVAISKCLQDLGVKLLNMKHFFFGDLPLRPKVVRELIAGKRGWPVSFHKVVTPQQFQILDSLRTAGAHSLYTLR